MNDSTNLSIDQHITKRVWSSWWEVCSALAWEKTRSGARGALRAASGRWGPRGPTLGKGDLTKAMMVLVKDDFSSSKRWWMFVENRTLFRMVSCFWTWQSTTVDSKTAKPAQSGKGRRIHWTMKGSTSRYNSSLKTRVDLEGTKSLQDINRSTCEIPLEWNWKIGRCNGNIRKKTAPWAYHDSFWFSNPPPKKMLCCRQFRRFHQKTSLLSPSSPKIWRVGGVLFRHNKRGRHFSRFFPAVGRGHTWWNANHVALQKQEQFEVGLGGRGEVAEWQGLGQWGWHLEDSGEWFFLGGIKKTSWAFLKMIETMCEVIFFFLEFSTFLGLRCEVFGYEAWAKETVWTFKEFFFWLLWKVWPTGGGEASSTPGLYRIWRVVPGVSLGKVSQAMVEIKGRKVIRNGVICRFRCAALWAQLPQDRSAASTISPFEQDDGSSYAWHLAGGKCGSFSVTRLVL